MFNLVVDSEAASERNFRTEISVRTSNKPSTSRAGTRGQKAVYVRIYVRDEEADRERKRERETYIKRKEERG